MAGLRGAVSALVPPDRFVDTMPVEPDGDDELLARARERGMRVGAALSRPHRGRRRRRRPGTGSARRCACTRAATASSRRSPPITDGRPATVADQRRNCERRRDDRARV
jgi:hypothetical protein